MGVEAEPFAIRCEKDETRALGTPYRFGVETVDRATIDEPLPVPFSNEVDGRAIV